MTGRKADVIKAAHLCAEAAIRLVKPGNQVSYNDSYLNIIIVFYLFTFDANC